MSVLNKISERFTPRAFKINKPIAQLFLNDEGIESKYSFTNFPSLYSPKTSTKYGYIVCLYDNNGKRVFKTEIEVPPLGTYYFNPKEHYSGELPKYGILTAQIKSPNLFYAGDNHLGKLTSHFYVFFSSNNNESLGVVHPQTSVKKQKSKFNSWSSNQVISTKNLAKIISFQLNPTDKPCKANIKLNTPDKNEIETQANDMNSMGVCKNIWSDFKGNEFVSLSLDKLTTPNAKPLVFLVFKDGSFTVSHA